MPAENTTCDYIKIEYENQDVDTNVNDENIYKRDCGYEVENVYIKSEPMSDKDITKQEPDFCRDVDGKYINSKIIF